MSWNAPHSQSHSKGGFTHQITGDSTGTGTGYLVNGAAPQVPETPTGPAVYLSGRAAGIQLTPGTGATAKAQYSMSGQDAVRSGAAVWNDWTPGSVTAATNATIQGASALRLNISVAGTTPTTLEVRDPGSLGAA